LTNRFHESCDAIDEDEIKSIIYAFLAKNICQLKRTNPNLSGIAVSFYPKMWKVSGSDECFLASEELQGGKEEWRCNLNTYLNLAYEKIIYGSTADESSEENGIMFP
jgi:hypothetical protein